MNDKCKNKPAREISLDLNTDTDEEIMDDIRAELQEISYTLTRLEEGNQLQNREICEIKDKLHPLVEFHTFFKVAQAIMKYGLLVLALLAAIYKLAPAAKSAETPSLRYLMFLYKIKTGCNLTITSGHRHSWENEEVGGAPNSWHLKPNRAFDIVSDCHPPKDLASRFRSVSTIIYPDHLHIDSRPEKTCLVWVAPERYRRCDD